MSDVKIVQVIPMENNSTWQGAVLGLGSDGVVYEFSPAKACWVVCLPLKFESEIE